MILFGNISRKGQPREPNEESRLVYPKLYQGTVLSLLRMDNGFLGRVSLRSFSPRELDLIRVKGMLSMPTVEIGEKLIAQGAGENNAPFSLSGTVSDANRINIKLSNLELMTGTNKRQSPRFLVNQPALIFRPELVNSEKKPEACELIEISMTGARIRSRVVYTQDQVLKLRVELYERAGKISFLCQVIRTSYNEDGLNDYGLLFEELPAAKKKYLREDLDWLATH